MTYEAWRISYQSSEQAARAAYAECARLQAKIEVMERQEPVAWCATDETGTVIESLGMNQSRRFDTALYLAPGAQPAPSFADAYQGAMEEVAIWKKRALEAEDLNRKFIARLVEPGNSGKWLGINCYVKTFDGHALEVRESISLIMELIKSAQEAKP